MSSSQRLLVELSTYFLQAAVAAGDRLVVHCEFAPDDATGLASFIAEHAAGLPLDVALIAPASGFAELLSTEETASLGTAAALLERASAVGGAEALVAACDVVEGRIPMTDIASGWLLTGMTADAANAAGQRLAELGLTPATLAPALPAELGAVVELVRNTPGDARVVVWEPGESSARLWIVSSAGIESVREAPAGFNQIFEAVQAGLGLKFRAAATKLFFNDHYEFGEAADKIAARLAAILREALGETPAALHVIGLPSGQAWLVEAMASSLASTVWTPAESTAYARYGVSADLLSPRVVGLLQAAAAGSVGSQWLPAWLTADTVMPTASDASPAPAHEPELTPAPVIAAEAPTPVQAPAKPAPVQAKPVIVTPAAAPARKKFPVVPVLAGVAVVGLLAGTTAFFLKSDTSPAPKIPSKPEAALTSVSVKAPVVNPAALEAEVKRDPLGFKNTRYQFTVSNKGVLTNFIAAGRPNPWLNNLGFVRLYGVSTLPDGRRSVRRAGDMASADYQARITKRVRDGVVVFQVDVSHPKYAFTQTFVCLPDSLKVEVRFKPKALVDGQGPLDAIYSVHLGTSDFTNPTTKPAMPPGELVYGTNRGPLILRYGTAFKGAGPQPVVGDPALASFVLAVAGGATEQVLDYEIILP